MNKLTKISLLLSIVLSSNACQDYTFSREIEKGKSYLIPHNLIVFNSSASKEPVKLRVSYSIKNSNTENKTIEKIVTLPYVLEMEDVIMKYDSLNLMVGGRGGKESVLGGARHIQHNYLKGGSDYFRVENLSNQEVEFAIIGNQKLVLENGNMIKSHPNPIYRGVSLLYLLKPNLSPNKDLFFSAARTYKDGGASQSSILRKISLKPNLLGEFNDKDLPFSIKKILDIYRNHSNNLYLDYFLWSTEALGINNENKDFQALIEFHKKKLYGKIKANETLINKGELPILALEFTPSKSF